MKKSDDDFKEKPLFVELADFRREDFFDLINMLERIAEAIEARNRLEFDR